MRWWNEEVKDTIARKKAAFKERERENLFDIALRTDTIIRLIRHQKHL